MAFLTNRSSLLLPSAIPYIFQRKSPALEYVDEADGSDFLEDFHHLMLMIFNFSDLALSDKAEVHFMKKKINSNCKMCAAVGNNILFNVED